MIRMAASTSRISWTWSWLSFQSVRRVPKYSTCHIH